MMNTKLEKISAISLKEQRNKTSLVFVVVVFRRFNCSSELSSNF